MVKQAKLYQKQSHLIAFLHSRQNKNGVIRTGTTDKIELILPTFSDLIGHKFLKSILKKSLLEELINI